MIIISQMNLEISELTPTELERYYSLLTSYGHEQAYEIVKGLTSRGKNSYSAFIEKSDKVTHAKHDDADYHTELYDAFPLGEEVSPGQVTQKVADVRRKLELDPYKKKLRLSSEGDFMLLFVFKEHIIEVPEENGKIKRSVIGYTPLARVRPELS